MPFQEKRGDFQLWALLLGFVPTAVYPVLNLAAHSSASWVLSAPQRWGVCGTRVRSNAPALPLRSFWPTTGGEPKDQFSKGRLFYGKRTGNPAAPQLKHLWELTR